MSHGITFYTLIDHINIPLQQLHILCNRIFWLNLLLHFHILHIFLPPNQLHLKTFAFSAAYLQIRDIWLGTLHVLIFVYQLIGLAFEKSSVNVFLELFLLDDFVEGFWSLWTFPAWFSLISFDQVYELLFDRVKFLIFFLFYLGYDSF